MIPINCEYSPYTLPTIDFVGGESQRLAFHTYFYKTGAPFSLSSCAADFSIASFTNRSETPVLSRLMDVEKGEDGQTDNLLTVDLRPEDTVRLSGKYIYQISIRDTSGHTEIPSQGIIYITKNINQSFAVQA